MKTLSRAMIGPIVAAALAALLTPAFAAPAQADQPRPGEGGKNAAAGQDRAGGAASHLRFGARERERIHAYYGARRSWSKGKSGRCPPGLAKRNNGCMPPGLAKKWRIGQALPRDVIFHDLPRDLARDLGRPPSGHRFVRVAEDILLIAVGTGLVLDAVDDIAKTLER